MKLKDKIAIVTGAGSGMGKATACLFAEEGAKVVLSDINDASAQAAAQELSDRGFDVLAVTTDVGDKVSVEALFQKTLEHFGHFDILINNAGIMDGMEPIGEVTDERWEKVFDVNTKSLLYTIRYAVNYFKENNIKGSIVNNLSLGGLYGARAGAAYTASKHAGVGITKNTAFMYSPDGIRCNAIAPGGIATNIASSMTNVSEFGSKRVQLSMAAMPPVGQSEQIAQTMLFLASDDASYVNGVILSVDGGWSAI